MQGANFHPMWIVFTATRIAARSCTSVGWESNRSMVLESCPKSHSRSSVFSFPPPLGLRPRPPPARMSKSANVVRNNESDFLVADSGTIRRVPICRCQNPKVYQGNIHQRNQGHAKRTRGHACINVYMLACTHVCMYARIHLCVLAYMPTYMREIEPCSSFVVFDHERKREKPYDSNRVNRNSAHIETYGGNRLLRIFEVF